MLTTPRRPRRDMHVLQAPRDASPTAWTENLFLDALQHPTHGLPARAYRQLDALRPEAARPTGGGARDPHDRDTDRAPETYQRLVTFRPRSLVAATVADT